MPTSYAELLDEAYREVPERTIAQIRMDVPRTFTALPEEMKTQLHKSEAAKVVLEHILVAAEWRHGNFARTDIGATYTQGMNYLVALCMADLWEEGSRDGEELAFWLFDRLLGDVLSPRFFAVWPPLLGYHSAAATFQVLAQPACPRLQQALGEEFEDVIAMLSVKYFIQCFVGLLPAESLLALWDELFDAAASGDVAPYRPLYRWLLALLQHLEQPICAQLAALPADEPKSPVAFQAVLAAAKKLAYGWRPTQQGCPQGPYLAELVKRSDREVLSQAEKSQLMRAKCIPQEQIEALRREFALLVPRSGGGIKKDALQRIWTRTGVPPSPGNVDCLFQILDRDGSGTLDFFELMTGLLVLSSSGRDQKLRLLFDLYDTDGSEELGADELLCLAKALVKMSGEEATKSEESPISPRPGEGGVSRGEKAAAAQFRRRLLLLDTNADGRLSWDEFRSGILVEPTIAQVLARAGAGLLDDGDMAQPMEMPDHLVPRGRLMAATCMPCCDGRD